MSAYADGLAMMGGVQMAGRMLGETLAARQEVEVEIAHAVALERNRCLAIMDDHLATLDRLANARDGGMSWRTEALRGQLVRDRMAGHNPQALTSGDSRGSGVPQVLEGTPRPSTDTSGPEIAESGMDSCRPSPESEDA